MRNKNDGYRLLELYRILRKMDKTERKVFYQQKADYYQFFVRIMLVIASMASVGYLFSDYQLNQGSFAPTIVQRLSIFVPLILYLTLESRATNYRGKVFLNYMMAHCILLATIWSVYSLQDKTHFSEGSFSLNLVMLSIAFGSSCTAGVTSYLFFLVELIVSNQFNHYPNFDVILSLNIPCFVGILMAQGVLNLAYLDHFIAEQKLENALVTDALTQVFSREKIDLIMEDADEEIQKAAVVMMDVDLFKGINDTYGHRMGDRVLCWLGDTLSKKVHPDDVVIRYGGDEFLIWMPGSSAKEAFICMEEIQRFIAEAQERPTPFTISVGISSYHGDFERSVAVADGRLYCSKEHGRNQITMA